MLQSRIFSFGVFSNNSKIDIVVSGLNSRKGFTNDYGGVNVESLSESDVPRVVAFVVDGSEQDTWTISAHSLPLCTPGVYKGLKTCRLTLESNLVALQTVHSTLEKLLSLVRLARNVVLFPLNRNFGSLKDLLDTVCYFGTDTISRYESDCVFAYKALGSTMMQSGGGERTAEFGGNLVVSAISSLGRL